MGIRSRRAQGRPPAAPFDAAFSTAATTTLINNATTLKVRDNFTPSTAAERLIRVKVNAASESSFLPAALGSCDETAEENGCCLEVKTSGFRFDNQRWA